MRACSDLLRGFASPRATTTISLLHDARSRFHPLPPCARRIIHSFPPGTRRFRRPGFRRTYPLVLERRQRNHVPVMPIVVDSIFCRMIFTGSGRSGRLPPDARELIQRAKTTATPALSRLRKRGPDRPPTFSPDGGRSRPLFHRNNLALTIATVPNLSRRRRPRNRALHVDPETRAAPTIWPRWRSPWT